MFLLLRTRVFFLTSQNGIITLPKVIYLAQGVQRETPPKNLQSQVIDVERRNTHITKLKIKLHHNTHTN